MPPEQSPERGARRNARTHAGAVERPVLVGPRPPSGHLFQPRCAFIAPRDRLRPVAAGEQDKAERLRKDIASLNERKEALTGESDW